jgi:hypothetical protein
MKEMDRTCDTYVSLRKIYTLVQKHARERSRLVWNDNIEVYPERIGRMCVEWTSTW